MNIIDIPLTAFGAVVIYWLIDHIESKFDGKISTIGTDLNLLNLKYKNLANKQSRDVHLYLHEDPKPKGQGKEALIKPFRM